VLHTVVTSASTLCSATSARITAIASPSLPRRLGPAPSLSRPPFPSGDKQGELSCPPVLRRALRRRRASERGMPAHLPPVPFCCAKSNTMRYLYSDLTMISPTKFHFFGGKNTVSAPGSPSHSRLPEPPLAASPNCRVELEQQVLFYKTVMATLMECRRDGMTSLGCVDHGSFSM
jgi:hypothetical protein